jgi:hypothetical protein
MEEVAQNQQATIHFSIENGTRIMNWVQVYFVHKSKTTISHALLYWVEKLVSDIKSGTQACEQGAQEDYWTEEG